MKGPTSLRLGDFSFDPPTGWAGQVIAIGPLEGGFRCNFVAVATPALPEETAEAFAIRQLPEVKKNTLDYAILKEGPAAFAHVKGWLRCHTFLQGATRLGQLQLYVVSDGIARTFTFTHLANRLDKARAVAESLFNSIKVFSNAPDKLRHGAAFRG